MPQAFGPLHRQSVLSITTKSVGGSIAADGRRGVRWQSVGRHLPGHVPLLGATWSFGETGLTNGDPQHAGCKRLWPARQQDAGAQAQLLRRAAMAEAHGERRCSNLVCPSRRPSTFTHTACTARLEASLCSSSVPTKRHRERWHCQHRRRYIFTSSDLQVKDSSTKWERTGVGGNDELPSLTGVSTAAGGVVFAPASISFLALPEAANNACR
jgi:hypothetical protein